MENVTIVGTEAGVLVLATESGARFALPIDDVLHTEIRRARRKSEPEAAKLAASPREIQAHVRAGMSAKEVAELLGVDLDVVERFESPVLAEREHIVGQALSVPVLIGSEVEPDAQPDFGTAVRAKLAEVGAHDERWTSWKEESGWIIKLQFTANDVDHDARWSFEPRRSALAPLNADATQLSRQGSLPDGLIPRLRAVDADRSSPYKDDSRFDSGAFGPRLVPQPEAESTDADESVRPGSGAAQEAALRRAPEESSTTSETADLLEALRRRRGQRENAPAVVEAEQERDADPIALFDALEEPEQPADQQQDASEAQAQERPAPDSQSRRKRRHSMPSWDEIVFGARTDD